MSRKMKNTLKTFGRTIREARKLKGYNLEELALLVKKEDGEPITHQYLSELENDRRNAPSDKIIKELASVLEIPVADLYLKAKRFPPTFDLKNAEHVAAARAMLRRLNLEELSERKEATAA